MDYFDKCKKEFGSVTEDDIEYAICDQAYLRNFGTDGGMVYEALAISRDQLANASDPAKVDFCFDSHAQVYWNLLDEYLNSDDTDEANACDWSSPSIIKIIG